MYMHRNYLTTSNLATTAGMLYLYTSAATLCSYTVSMCYSNLICYCPCTSLALEFIGNSSSYNDIHDCYTTVDQEVPFTHF